MSNSISIKAISELLGMNFFIPSYQRGYRWDKQQVEELLDDIYAFATKKDKTEEEFYCLQPVIVKKKEKEEWYEVIDGQQRLTTIFLIIHYINEIQKEKQEIEEITLRFETRDKSQEFLNGILVNENSNEVIINDDNIDNIDFFFISNAYNTIHNWNKSNNKLVSEDFVSKFICSSKVIWYEVSKDEDSIDIFTRINSGKIPLTNAELIKALFLNSSNFPDSNSESLRLKQLEIASEWDRIEYTLQDDSFWYFINKKGNNLATRIEFIFNLMYEVAKEDDKEVSVRRHLNIKSEEQIKERQKTHLTIEEKHGNDKYSTFRFFNEKFKTKKGNEITNNWQEIKKYFQTFEEWYNERELYHKVGYLITIGADIKDILKEKNGKSKTEFVAWLNNKIKKSVNVNINIDELEYGNGNIRKILLLHNIQTMLNNKNETNRFPFDRFKKEFWDVEHIHAIATEVKVKKEKQVDWLKNNFIKTENHKDENRDKQIEQIINLGNPIDEKEFDYIIDYVLGEEDNSLQNLCLLDRGTNRSYKNDSFKEKRRKIIKREMEGTFIPICTKNVFMKYYSEDVKDIEVWNEADRKSYFKKIQEVINQYLPQTTLAENEQ